VSERSVVRLPAGIQPPFEVYVNGVLQEEGRDYEVRERDGALVFGRLLAQEGKVSLWRWLVGAFGVGTYRAHDSVDVRYTLPDGRPTVAENLKVDPPG
jgi:hypothetical protein